MAKKRLKRIQAGRLVREALWTAPMSNDSPKARAEKSKCSSAARQRMNDKYSWQRLKMTIAANFGYSDIVVTLTYDDAHLPKDKEAARQILKKFFAALRSYRRTRGETLKYIYCTEDKHGDGRIHHHVILNGTGEDYELIRSLWCYGSNLEFERLDIYGYEELAKYMTKEAREFGHGKVGARTWVPSKGLAKPVVETEWVDAGVRLDPPRNAHIIASEHTENEWGKWEYLEYLLPEDPPMRRVRPQKRKPKSNKA